MNPKHAMNVTNLFSRALSLVSPACRSARPQLVAFDSGDLSEARMVSVAEHLADCPRCQAEFERVSGMGDLLRDAAPLAATPAPDLWSRLEVAIAAEPARALPTPAPRPRPRFAPAMALASVVAVAGAAGLTLRSARDNAPTRDTAIRTARANPTLSAGEPGPRRAEARPAMAKPTAPALSQKVAAKSAPRARVESRPDPFATLPEVASDSAESARDARFVAAERRLRARNSDVRPRKRAVETRDISPEPTPERILIAAGPPERHVKSLPNTSASVAGADVADSALREASLAAELAQTQSELAGERGVSAANVAPADAIRLAGLQRSGLFR